MAIHEEPWEATQAEPELADRPADTGVQVSPPTVLPVAATLEDLPAAPAVERRVDAAEGLDVRPVTRMASVFRPIKVVDVHLDRPLETLSGLERYGHLQALVRLHGMPLGYVRLPVIDGRCPAARQRDLIVERLGAVAVLHLAADRLRGGLRSNHRQPLSVTNPRAVTAQSLPSIAVAVCTRDRTDSLAGCLEAIRLLDYPDLEVLVVDNAPTTDATKSLVEERFPTFRYVREDRPGLDWARNRALHETRAEIIAYTDDDVVVDPGWARALGATFAEAEQVSAVTGLVVPLELETPAQLLFELYGGFGRGFKTTWYKAGPRDRIQTGAGRFGTGANMAFRRSVLLDLGGFDPALDVGTVTNGGGDLEMFFRVLQEGHVLVYEPSALVRHRHRRDYESLRKQLTDNGIGLVSYLVRSAIAYPQQRRNLAWVGRWWLVRWILRRVAICWIRPGRLPADLILADLRGGLIGLTRYPRARRRAAAIERAHRSTARPAREPAF